MQERRQIPKMRQVWILSVMHGGWLYFFLRMAELLGMEWGKEKAARAWALSWRDK
jgi:hypothetical protein